MKARIRFVCEAGVEYYRAETWLWPFRLKRVVGIGHTAQDAVDDLKRKIKEPEWVQL